MRYLLLAAAALAVTAAEAAPLTDAQKAEIDTSIAEWLAKTGAPSVSIAVVNEGDIAYVKAYGNARLSPDRPATEQTRYGIYSVSKQFTAAAILLLQQDGKLSLDDKVGKYFPDLASADKVTIRQILSHTGGYRDYWPQDFVPPELSRPASVRQVLDAWARKPLDFEPGTEWQYSNTGFVIAGAIVEKVAQKKLVDLLQERVFAPLKMTGVMDHDAVKFPPEDAGPYTRFGLGPVRVAPPEGAGWMYAAGELGMAPSELAKWDISFMDRSLLSKESYDALYAPIELANGKDSHYSLGLHVETKDDRLVVDHGGAGSGFLAANMMWPEQKVAIVALTNNDWAGPDGVVQRVATIVLPPNEGEARARAVFDGFQKGAVDRSLFTDNGNAYLTDAVLADHQAGLGDLGPIRVIGLRSSSMRGGMETRVWTLVTAKANLRVVERGYPNGKLEQFMVSRAD